MNRHLWAIISTLSVCVATFAAATPAAAADEPLPVPYSFVPSAVLGGTPGANAPGTNDFGCKPNRRHPRPVVLVHGTGGNRSTNWQTYGPLLKNNGFCVFAPTYGSIAPLPYPGAFGGLASIPKSAAEFGKFVDRVLRVTGARRVDLIGHSQGTLMPNYWIKFLGGAGKVRNYVSLAPLWKGTQVASPLAVAGPAFGTPSLLDPLCAACAQMGSGSRFMKKMRRGGVAVAGVNYLNLVTKYDQAVIPYTSGIERGMRNVVLQERCAEDFTEHLQIAADRNATRIVLNTLDPAHRRPLRCVPVAPFVGEGP